MKHFINHVRYCWVNSPMWLKVIDITLWVVLLLSLGYNFIN